MSGVRTTYTDLDGSIDPNTEIIEESNYYPFGLKQKGYNFNYNPIGNSTAQKFKYNGKELNESLGLNLYEMDMRQYDPAIARWTGIDPVTHFSMSTYSAFDNNPVFWADPSGADATNEALYDEKGRITVVDGKYVPRNQRGEEKEESNNQSTQPKYQFFGISPTGEKMNLNFGTKDFDILTGYGDDPEFLRKAKLSAYKSIFKTLSTKDKVSVLRFFKIPSKYWVGLLNVTKISPTTIMPAYDVYDEGFASLPFVGSVFQPLNDRVDSESRLIENVLMWDDVLSSFNEMMNTESLNDVIIIYTNENLFRKSTINTNEAEKLDNRYSTGNYRYAYYGTQNGSELYIFGMYFINND